MNTLETLKATLMEGFTKNLGTVPVLVGLGTAIVFGMLIYFIYRLNCQGGFYDRGFNKSLAILPVITAGIILAMRSNVLISLGMVGALSIVRFRNAVKEPMDLTYLFWSISVGIACGVGLLELTILLSICVIVLIFGLEALPAFRDPYILVINGEAGAAEKDVLESVKNCASHVRVRSRNISQKQTEWILELKTKKPEELIKAVSAAPGVTSSNLLSHDGDVRF